MLFLPALPTTDVVTRAAVVEGYNTNTYQSQDDPNVPVIRRHPSPFTGVEGAVELRLLGRDTDHTSLIAGVRVNHYEPLQTQQQSDDGAFNASLVSHLTLGPRTTLSLTDSGSVTTFNAAHVTDGTIFAFDPTQTRSTYWLNDLNASIAHQLSPKLRLTQSIGATVSGTLKSAPIQLSSGQLVEHRGIDYVMPYVEADLNEDFTPRSSGDVMVLYQYAYQLFVVDFTQSPPRNIGPDRQAFLTGLVGYTRHFSPELSAVLRVGGVLASAPPRDVDQRPVLSPAWLGELYYSRPFFDFVAAGGYTWGTINPRLGAGPSATGSLLAIGVPHHVGRWRDLALIGSVQVSYSSLVIGAGQASGLGLYAAGVEVRYGVSRWLGLLGGYQVRYATFQTPTFNPPFLQQVFFVGLSGYWSTDRAQPAIVTFAPPVQPPA